MTEFPRRLTFLVASMLTAILVALGVWALLPTNSSTPSVVTVDGGSDRFPSETLTDWVSYGDQVSVVSVVGEEALPPARERYLARAVTLRIERTIWMRQSVSPTEGAVRVITYGWAVEESGRRPAAAWGGPRLEVRARYLAPLVRAPRGDTEWTTLADGATLPLDGETITTAGILGSPSPVAKELAGKSIDEVAAILARTRPNPGEQTD